MSNSLIEAKEAHSFVSHNHPHFTTTSKKRKSNKLTFILLISDVLLKMTSFSADEDIEEQADYEQTKKHLVLISRQQVEKR